MISVSGHSEDILWEREEMYRLHFSLANDVMFTYDQRFRMESISPNVERILGYKPEELVGRTFPELGILDPSDLEEAVDDALHVLAGGVIHASVYQFITSEGKKRIGEVSGVPHKRGDRVIGVISVARDITDRMLMGEELERHRDHLEDLVGQRTEELRKVNERLQREIHERLLAEEALKESEQRYRTIYEHTPDAVLLADIETRHLIMGNNQVRKAFGYGIDEIPGLTVMDLHPQEYLPAVLDTYDRMSRSEISLAQDIPVKRKDGSIYYADVRGLPMNLGGKTYLAGVFRDISERRHAQEELKKNRDHLEDLVRERTAEITTANEVLRREVEERRRVERILRKNEERYRLHFSLSDDVMFSWDNKLRITSVSPNVERILGYRPENLVGRQIHEINVLDPADMNEAMDNALHLLSGKKVYSSIYRFITKDGRVRFGELSEVPILRNGKVVEVVSVARDITDRIAGGKNGKGEPRQ